MASDYGIHLRNNSDNDSFKFLQNKHSAQSSVAVLSGDCFIDILMDLLLQK